jgi:hypothetical protein
MALPDAYGTAVERVRRAMEAADIPLGWLPAGADDPVLLEVFTSYWAVSESNCPPEHQRALSSVLAAHALGKSSNGG